MKKIRILHCVTAMNRGGLETLIMNIYRNIDKSKFDFDFLVQKKGVFDYSCEINNLGGKIYTVDSFNPFKILKYESSIDSFFRSHANEYDIVHAHNNSFAMYVLKYAKKYGIKTRIAHSHTTNNSLSLKTPFVIYNKLLLKKYYTNQFACGTKASEWLFGNKNSYIIKNAIDISNFCFSNEKRIEIRDKLNIKSDEIVIGHVGRFEKEKNHSFLIKLLNQCKSENINAKLVLIGDGSLKKMIQEKIEKLGLTKNTIFIGNIDNVNDYLNAMDVFVLPSFFEGLPVTLIEAQSNGLKCLVSSNVSDECSITSNIYFMSLNKSISKWCAEIVKLSKLPRLDESYKIIESGFEIKSATKKLENIYLELINNNGQEEQYE